MPHRDAPRRWKTSIDEIVSQAPKPTLCLGGGASDLERARPVPRRFRRQRVTQQGVQPMSNQPPHVDRPRPRVAEPGGARCGMIVPTTISMLGTDSNQELHHVKHHKEVNKHHHQAQPGFAGSKFSRFVCVHYREYFIPRSASPIWGDLILLY